MIAIITALAPAILSILSFVLDRMGVSVKTKLAFLNMVESMGQEGLISVKLHKSYEDQRQRLMQ